MKKLLQKLQSRSDVAVLGGGISGITTAIVLQSLGFHPVVITEYVPRQEPLSRPLVPTDFAMASAYPHDLRVAGLEQITDDSQTVFAYLAKSASSGITPYRIFEMYESEQALPKLHEKRLNFWAFDGHPAQLRGKFNPPTRREADHVWGWCFDTFFADMPPYLQVLWQIFAERGGERIEAHIESVEQLANCEIPIVNCLGIGAKTVFNDTTPTNAMRGRQVIAHSAPMIYQDGMPVCFNYTPTAEVFSRADGTPEYVHFFPRHDGWVLGQTREPGTFDAHGYWHGAEVTAPHVQIGAVSVPKPLLDLNAELLMHWKGVTFEKLQLTAREGYRYYRDSSASGVRLESEQTRDAFFVHNYGHGGSGVTVSWGCAIRSAQLLLNKVSPVLSSTFTNEFDKLIRDLAHQAISQPTVQQLIAR